MNSPRHSRLCTLRTTTAVLLLGLLSAPAFATHVGEDLNTDQQLVQSSDQLLASLKQFEMLPAAVQAQRLAQLQRLAQARRDRLIRLIERNPKLAAIRLMAPGLRERFPQAVRPYLEEEGVTISGNAYGLVASDVERGYSKVEYFLQASAGGAPYKLAMGDPTGSERDTQSWAGKALRVVGVRVSEHLLIKDKSTVQAVSTTTTGTSGSTSVSTNAVISGNQKTLVIIANFSDKPVACTAADVSNRVFGATGPTVNVAFQESSRGAVGFSGQVVGPVNIPYTSTGSCNFSGWASAADAAAKAAGVDPAQYQRVSYVTPANATCGWTGLAYMPGRQSWVQSCSSTGVYIHEVGHNLALHHAGTPASEYGDSSDPMGGARTVRNNGANQAMAGWLPTGGLVDVRGGGSYAIAPLSPSTSGAAQVLRLEKRDTAEFYYLSMRQNSGLDSNLATSLWNNLSIHRATGALPAKTTLVQVLTPGTTFADSINGLQISYQGISNGQGMVNVTSSGGTCSRVAPTLSLAPGTATSGPGGSATYTVKVTNNNSAACGTSTFNFAQGLPSGFSGAMQNTALAVAAGTSASVNWNVTAGSTVPNATYTLDLSAVDTASATATSLVHASYAVYSDGTPPTLAVINPTPGQLLTGRTASFSATASDASGIAAVEFYFDGKLLVRSTAAPYKASLTLRKVSAGRHTVTVKAFDIFNNVTQQDVVVEK